MATISATELEPAAIAAAELQAPSRSRHLHLDITAPEVMLKLEKRSEGEEHAQYALTPLRNYWQTKLKSLEMPQTDRQFHRCNKEL